MRLNAILAGLDPWELDMLDAEAAACGMTRAEMVLTLIREGLALEFDEGGGDVMPLLH